MSEVEAIEFGAGGDVALVRRPRAPLPPGHARVAVAASGLCHTDVAILEGAYGTGALPLVPGHEFAGTVTDVANDVDGVAIGDRVVVDPNLPCGRCAACLRGDGNLCPDLGAYGVTVDGGFAGEAVVLAAHLLPVGDMPFARAALAEPLGCVLNGLRAAGVARAERAVVFGAGPIGLMIALALRQGGSPGVRVVDRDRPRLDMVGRTGLVPVEAGTPLAPEHDFAADATGVTAVVASLLGTLAPGGTALVMGVCPPEARIAVSPHALFRRQLKMVGSHSLAARDLVAARDMLAAAGDAFDPLVSHRLPLAEVVPFLAGQAPGPRMKVQADPTL